MTSKLIVPLFWICIFHIDWVAWAQNLNDKYTILFASPELELWDYVPQHWAYLFYMQSWVFIWYLVFEHPLLGLVCNNWTFLIVCYYSTRMVNFDLYFNSSAVCCSFRRKLCQRVSMRKTCLSTTIPVFGVPGGNITSGVSSVVSR